MIKSIAHIIQTLVGIGIYLLSSSVLAQDRDVLYTGYASVRYGGIPYQQNLPDKNLTRLYLSLDFLQEIEEIPFHIGGGVSWILKDKEPKNNQEQYYERETVHWFAEIYVRKYFCYSDISPYLQLSTSHQSVGVNGGAKINLWFFDMELSAGYAQPFSHTSLYATQGVNVSFGVAFNLELWARALEGISFN